MAGVGTSPAGLCPAGIGQPEAAPLPPTGTSTMCRAIDQRSRDYTIDVTTGHLTQTTPVRQRVQIRLCTELTSASADAALGMGRIAKMGDRFEKEVEALVYRALHQEIEVERIVEIQSIFTKKGPRRAAVHVRFVDLTTGEGHEVSA